VEAYRVYPQPRTAEIAAHRRGIAWKLQGTNPSANVLVVVSLNLLDPCSMRWRSRRRSRWRARGVKAWSCSIRIPIRWPKSRRISRAAVALRELSPVDDGREPDRPPPSQLAVFRAAEKEYEANTGERIAHWQRRLLARYTRNLALVRQRALGRDLRSDRGAPAGSQTTTTRGTCGKSPAAIRRSAPTRRFMTVRISGDEVWINTRKICLRRRLPSTKRRLRPFGLKPRKKEKFPGEWASQLDGGSICSYPPEDLIIEDYGRFLKGKGKSLLSEERVRVEPFTTSILDGVDIRETIRKWYEGRIYVRHFQKIQGEVGSVVVIFDEDRDNRYPYTTTWLVRIRTNRTWRSTRPSRSTTGGPGSARRNTAAF
jgi:hypothetical protein